MTTVSDKSAAEASSVKSGYEITKRQKFWMNFKPYQFIRFVILNLKILKAVDHSKRS